MTDTTISLHERPRLYMSRLGLWLFILSETMIFLALLASRLALQGYQVPDEANQVIALAITSVLLASSGTAYLAEASAAAGRREESSRWLAWTIVLGLVFLVGVGLEWREAFHAFRPETGFGTVFFTMTGMHAFHVLTGIVFLWIVWGRTKAGTYSAGSYWPVEGAAKYWHFVDVVWVFFYPALYLIS
jgi:cytochrome c oxidase subunit 3